MAQLFTTKVTAISRLTNSTRHAVVCQNGVETRPFASRRSHRPPRPAERQDANRTPRREPNAETRTERRDANLTLRREGSRLYSSRPGFAFHFAINVTFISQILTISRTGADSRIALNASFRHFRRFAASDDDARRGRETAVWLPGKGGETPRTKAMDYKCRLNSKPP